MAFDNETLVNLNRGQEVSATDTFTGERYEQFVKHFPERTVDVLDIGCNTGRGGAIMMSKVPGLRVVGLDCVPDRLAELDTTVYAQTICGFADQVDLPSNSFDVIVAGEIIEHVPSKDVYPTLCECFR